MTIFSCKHELVDMLTTIYEAWTSKKGFKNIILVLEPVEQYNLFDEYIHVEGEEEKAFKVMEAVRNKISPYTYHQLAYLAMSSEKDVLDIMYRVMLLGFSYGADALQMVQFREVMRYQEMHKSLGNEVCRFREFLRFREIDEKMYVAHIEPRSRIVQILGKHFEDRMPSEHWIIVDDTHREAIVHPKDEECFLVQLSEEEYQRLLTTENQKDEFIDLWKTFFHAVAIQQRMNKKCQDNHFPIWTRKHAVEFL